MMERLVYFPSPTQELLLKAALLNGRQAIESWNAWRLAIAVDDLDIGSQRLLPLLYQNMRRSGVRHPEMERYQSVHRYVWVANQLRVRQTVEILALLEAARIPVILLKGIALAPLCYSDLGRRPMSDLDFLVPPECAGAAGRVLAAGGWQSADLALLDTASFRSANHAACFTKQGTPAEIDLHWYTARELIGESADADLWARAQDIEVGGVFARTLSDTDHLFVTCIHGAQPNEVAPIRWVADAVLLIQRGKIDWQLLLRKTREGGLSRRFGGVFRYLSDEFHAPIPAAVTVGLALAPLRKVELFEEWLARRQRPQIVVMFGLLCSSYTRNSNYPALRDFGGFIRARWGAQSILQTFEQGIQKASKHLFH